MLDRPSAVIAPLGEDNTQSISCSRSPSGDTSDELPKGTEVGRYVILDKAGAGGMGIVYSAYDPALDRKVALKFVRNQAHGSFGSVGAETRLQREAQALAKLSHGNIVTVFDVGTFGDDVFLAMEFLVGQTLQQWLKQAERSWQEIVDVMVDAGRGLAAAHAASLVHRDVKPSNILVTDDGRVLVMDFGLVQSQTSGHEWQPSSAAITLTNGALDSQMTAHGEIMGTPSYMSPEQHDGEQIGPATDQFAFCVTLYEALYGVRPFVAETFAGLHHAVDSGKIQPPERNPGPRRLLDAVRKGLRAEPGDRHPSMDALLVTLQSFRRRRNRAWTLASAFGMAAAATGYAAAAAAGTAPVAPPPLQCDGGSDQWAQVWTEDTATAVHTAFMASGKPYAADASERVNTLLNDYGQRWTDQHQEACAATQIRAEQSEHLMDLRMACLDRKRSQVSALVGQFRDPKDGTVSRAASAVYSLRSPDDCGDTETLLGEVAPPTDEATRTAVAEIRSTLDEVSALSRTGQFSDALARAEDAFSAVQSVDYPPLRAEVVLTLAYRQQRVGRLEEASTTALDAMLLSESAEHSRFARKASGLLAYLEGERGQLDRARLWTDHAAALTHGQLSPRAEASMLSTTGLYLLKSHQSAEAAAALQRAIELVVDEGPTPLLGVLYNNVASALETEGRGREALEAMQQAIDVARHIGGDFHPSVGSKYASFGLYAKGRGYHRLARRYFADAVSILTAVDPKSAAMATAHIQLAGLYNAVGEFDKALELTRDWKTVVHATYGDNFSRETARLRLMGVAQRYLGNYKEARIAFERGGAILRSIQPDDPYADLSFQSNASGIDFERGRYDQALTIQRKLLESAQTKWGVEDAKTRGYHAAVGRSAWRAGHVDEARSSLRTALEMGEPSIPWPFRLSSTWLKPSSPMNKSMPPERWPNKPCL